MILSTFRRVVGKKLNRLTVHTVYTARQTPTNCGWSMKYWHSGQNVIGANCRLQTRNNFESRNAFQQGFVIAEYNYSNSLGSCLKSWRRNSSLSNARIAKELDGVAAPAPALMCKLRKKSGQFKPSNDTIKMMSIKFGREFELPEVAASAAKEIAVATSRDEFKERAC